MHDPALSDAVTQVARVPPGLWAVGVSGGADSVALLLLLRDRPDLALHVVHLDHQTRGAASTADAEFVRELAARLNLPCTVARRQEMEATTADLPANPSARYRALRLALFRRVVAEHGLSGVLLAHHADDVAETVLHRLLRGSGPMGLCGIDDETTVGGLRIRRPLLGVRGECLRTFLRTRGQGWREDASNASEAYARNRLRRALAANPAVTADLLHLAGACRALRDWARAHAPQAGEALPAEVLRRLPLLLARETARRWLLARGAPADELSADVLDRLIDMAADAATAPGQHFPGGVLVRRRAGVLFV